MKRESEERRGGARKGREMEIWGKEDREKRRWRRVGEGRADRGV